MQPFFCRLCALRGFGLTQSATVPPAVPKEKYKCEQCEKVRKTKQYEYQNAKFIEEYVPKMWKALCGKCAKRECGKRIFDNFTLGE